MSEFELNLPKRFDEEEAKKGILVPIYDELEQYYGTYHIALFDLHANHVQLAMKRWGKKNKNVQMKRDYAMISAFVEVSLLGWEGVPFRKDGLEVPFTKENATKILNQDGASWLTEQLLAIAQNVKNFTAEPEVEIEGEPVVDVEATKETDAKNSKRS